MAFEKICTLDDVWEGEMAAFKTTDGQPVLVVALPGEIVKAYQAMCPHQEIALVEGDFDGELLTCRAHLWEFDAKTGKGVNPADCHLAEYPIRIEGEDVFIDVAGVTPVKSHA